MQIFIYDQSLTIYSSAAKLTWISHVWPEKRHDIRNLPQLEILKKKKRKKTVLTLPQKNQIEAWFTDQREYDQFPKAGELNVN